MVLEAAGTKEEVPVGDVGEPQVVSEVKEMKGEVNAGEGEVGGDGGGAEGRCGGTVGGGGQQIKK